MEENLSWLNEDVLQFKNGSKIYNFICFFLRRKLKYKELYLILYTLNEKKLGKELSKKKTLQKVLEIYKENNNKLPENFNII